MNKNRCSHCNRETSSPVKITQIRGNQKSTVTLCRECASAMGFHNPLDQMPFPLAKILGSFVDQSLAPLTKHVTEQACKDCGMTFQQFSQQGRFGCGSCYSTFRPQLETILRKIHGHSIHRGKSNSGVVETNAPVTVAEQKRLEDEYKLAIEREEFERAAELRDRLKEIRTQVKEALAKSQHDSN